MPARAGGKAYALRAACVFCGCRCSHSTTMAKKLGELRALTALRRLIHAPVTAISKQNKIFLLPGSSFNNVFTAGIETELARE
jgi:hypothetical protein